MRLVDADAMIDVIKAGMKEDGNFESNAERIIDFINQCAEYGEIKCCPYWDKEIKVCNADYKPE